MTNHDENTPIDRPVTVRDLNSVRQAVWELTETVVEYHEASKRQRREPRILAGACLVCAVVSIGCAIASLAARDTVVRAAEAAQVRP